ncbi:MAG: outer membrane protein [Hyphomicrobiaceae bacterium]
MRDFFKPSTLGPRDVLSAGLTGLLMLGLLTLTSVTSAHAADWTPPAPAAIEADDGSGVYLSVGGGGQWLADLDIGGGIEDKAGGFGKGAVGYDTGMFRAEVEASVGYNALDVGPVDVNVWTPGLFANAYFDLDNSTGFTPYAGAGAGISLVTVGPFSETVYAWQGMAGVSIDVTDHATLSLGYTFRRYEDVVILGVDLGHVDRHSVDAGFRFRF